MENNVPLEGIVKIDPPLPGAFWKFIHAYVLLHDVEKAALQAKITPATGRRIYRLPRIYREIQKIVDERNHENAKMMAVQARLTVEFLDANLVETVSELEPGVPKVKALELGYARKGILSKGAPVEKTQAPAETPQVYQAFQFRTVKRTEEITEGQQITTTKRPALPPADDDEILDY